MNLEKAKFLKSCNESAIAGQWMTRYMSIVPPCDTIRDAQLTRIACSHSLPRDDASPPVEQDACDHEHCRYRQHVCKSFRGRPLGGLFHAVFSLNLGMTYRCAKDTQHRQNFTRNTPRRCFADQTPCREYRPCENRIVIRRQFGSVMLLLRQSADTVLAKPTTTYDSPR